MRDRSRSAGTKAHGIAARLRSRAQVGRDEAKAGVQKITGELAGLAQSAIKDARKLLVNARRAANRAEWFSQVDKPLEVHDILGA